MLHKVFVYGTLKKGEPNHYWLTDPENGQGKFICEAKTTRPFPLIIGTKYNIPFLLYAPGTGHYVKGEIYQVDDLMLGKLDILEGHPNMYQREIDDLSPLPGDGSEGSNIKCWVYYLKNFKAELLSRDMIESYSSLGPHGLPYLERWKRDPNYNWLSEIRNNEATEDDLNDF